MGCVLGTDCKCTTGEQAKACDFWEVRRQDPGRDPRERNPRYLAWIAKLPCIACLIRTGRLNHEVQVAHIRASYLGEEGWREVGKAEKPHDWRTAPLCVKCHLDGKRAQHKSNETEWWRELGVYPPALCKALRAAFDAGRSGEIIIARAAASAAGIRSH